jgi:hypothetical protein
MLCIAPRPDAQGEIRARVAVQKSDLASKRAQIQQLKLSLESARVRLAEAYVEWKISNEMGTSPDSPAAATFMPSPTAAGATFSFSFSFFLPQLRPAMLTRSHLTDCRRG